MEREVREKEEEKGGEEECDHILYPIEHSYIDFNWLIINEKIRAINNVGADEVFNLRFDHLFYAELIMSQYDNLKFFSASSVRKIIDFQFEITKQFMEGQFWFYMIFFVLPYSITLLTTDRKTQITALKICIIP